MELTLEKRKILELLAREFPNRRAAFAEIINLQAILHLPKGTEHYMSDLHGEYEAFKHILNNCAGVIKEKVALLFGDTLTPAEQAQLIRKPLLPNTSSPLVPRSIKRLISSWFQTMLARVPAVISPPT